MERGNFRCDANVSIRPRGQEKFGRRVELKNINSFRFVEQAIEIEILRHAQILSEGGTVAQETRLFDPDKKETRTMRSKEEAEDYRYFPDPDLPPLVLEEQWIREQEALLPELPAARRTRWIDTWKVPEEHAQVFSEERALADFFDEAVGDKPDLAEPIAHLVKTEILRELKDEPEAIKDSKLAPGELRSLVEKKAAGKISSSQTKKLLGKMWKDGTPLEKLLEDEGEQIQDPQILIPIIDELLTAHAKEADKLRAGQTKVSGFFVGQVMKRTRGKADPGLVGQLLSARISKD